MFIIHAIYSSTYMIIDKYSFAFLLMLSSYLSKLSNSDRCLIVKAFLEREIIAPPEMLERVPQCSTTLPVKPQLVIFTFLFAVGLNK